MSTVVDPSQFRTRGFVVLRAAFDPEPLAREVRTSLEESARGSFSAAAGSGVIAGRYVPMTCERTPRSLDLLDQLEPIAATLLGGAVLPTRAKGVLYAATSPWHRDSTGEVQSVGFAAYLQPLRALTGALRVIPESHLAQQDAASLAPDAGEAVETNPGDVIAFDERLLHASSGGRDRLQWRVDYVLDPLDAESEARVRAWYARQHPPDWDGGYDVERFPSYGAHWLASGRRCVARLRELGVYDAATKEEAFARARHSARRSAPSG